MAPRSSKEARLAEPAERAFKNPAGPPLWVPWMLGFSSNSLYPRPKLSCHELNWNIEVGPLSFFFFNNFIILFSLVQSLSCVLLFVTPWTAACQASLSITSSWSLHRLMSIESVMPSNHLSPLLLLPSVFPNIRVFSNESVLHIRCQRIGVSASASVFPMPSSSLKGILFPTLNIWKHIKSKYTEFENFLHTLQSNGRTLYTCNHHIWFCCLEFTQKGASWQPGLPPLQLLTPWVHLHFLCFWLFRRN